jgi:hypothetical protein
VAALGVWLVNPFLALLAVPAAHAWLTATLDEPRRRLGVSIAALALSLLPAIVAFGWLAGQLDVGAGVPWHLLLMVGGGHLGPGTALLGCLLAGCLVAVLAAALARTHAIDEPPRIAVRGPGRRSNDVSAVAVSGTEGATQAPSAPTRRLDDRRIFEAAGLTVHRSRAD